MEQEQSAIEKLIETVFKLRDPTNGCPWDLKQDHKSLIPYVIEEAYEVADAIKSENDKNLCEELGDLLFQVVMHAQIAKEENRFCFQDVANVVTKKMIRRHPHVFQDKTKKSLEEIKESWEAIKKAEQVFTITDSPFSDEISRKIRSKSTMKGAIHISKKIFGDNKGGINVEDKLNTVKTEIKQFENEILENNQISAEKTIGKLLFNLINICTINKIDCHEGLAQENRSFLNKLKTIEKTIKTKLTELTFDEIKILWKEKPVFLEENSAQGLD